MLPAQLTIHDCAIALDGGTRYLRATDELGRDHAVLLVQHARPHARSDREIPGRLYFDSELLPIRSVDEATVLSLLRSVVTPNDLVALMVTGIIEFVESEEYLRFAEQVERAADPTRYDVWVVWDAESFNRAVVRTKQLLGVGMREARQTIEQGEPVARGVTAEDVVKWANRYREAKLGVRVIPEFRWQLPLEERDV